MNDLVHEKGNLYHYDMRIPDHVIIDPRGDKIIRDIYEHTVRRIRSENFFIYKVEEMDVPECQLSYGISQIFRIHLVRLGNPVFVIKKRTQKLGVLN